MTNPISSHALARAAQTILGGAMQAIDGTTGTNDRRGDA
jgi:multisubunit Na+/H+ antiporter MnhG subunit